MEFSDFMDAKGCTSGTHVFVEEKKTEVVKCRNDFYQTGGNVCVNIYAKKVDGDASSFDASEVELNCKLKFLDETEFHFDVDLEGVVDPSKSKVTIAAPKVEIMLKKADVTDWSELGTIKK